MLTPNRRFALALEALAELKTEISIYPEITPRTMSAQAI